VIRPYRSPVTGETGFLRALEGAFRDRRSCISSGIAAVYNRYAYEREKRDALDLWAETKDAARNTGEKRPHQAIDLVVQRFKQHRSAVAENCAKRFQ
jgi:hypothetical protein